MEIRLVEVEDVLRDRQHPLKLLELHALSNVREPYRAVLLQPEGVIEATDLRVGHADPAMGHAICSEFLLTASRVSADLAVAPEYCVPWTVIDQIIDGRYRPPIGALWILGCESIAPAELRELAARCNAGEQCAFHHEPLDARQLAQKRYADPLLYVFWASDAAGRPVLFLLAQFKTVPCRDYRDVEQTSLYLGTKLYRFNHGVSKIGLLSLVCSDAFAFTAHVDQAHINCLLIHIQLNPRPAHEAYAAYRARLCQVGTENHVELLCVNWARNVRELMGGGNTTSWNNVAGSAWYAPPAKFRADDRTIDHLHKQGLYYTLLAKRWHAFVLNYEPQVLQLQKQKLFFIGEQALVPRNFVAVEDRWAWNEVGLRWESPATADDGFAVAVASYGAISAAMRQACSTSPLAVERAIELLVGPSGNPTSWYEVDQLDAIQLDQNEESIRRVTVHQDSVLTRPGVIYRRSRLQRAHDAIGLPSAAVPWPTPVSDLADGFQFVWRAEVPHHNIESLGEGRTAALAYLSDQVDDLEIESVYRKLDQAISNHATMVAVEKGLAHGALSDEVVRARDRLCVVYRRGPEYVARGQTGTKYYDRPAGGSPVDITEGQ